jgi:integrase
MAKISLWEARSQYLDHLRAQGLSASTITNHGQMLNAALNRWGNVDLRDLGPAEIDRYFSGRTWQMSTQNAYLISLRQFFSWCRIHGYLPMEGDITAGWRTRRVTPRTRTWLTVPEMGELLDAAWCGRDRAFMALGLYTFARASEITMLTVGDLRLDRDELAIFRPKTKQRDVLPVCTELAIEMRRWLLEYEATAGPLDPSWLLVPARGPMPMAGGADGRLAATGAPRPLKVHSPITKPYEIVRRAMKTIGYDRIGDGAHVLRRSGARALFGQLRADGYDGALRRVSSLLGHSSTEISERYLGMDAERRERNLLLGGKPMFPAAA